MALRSGSDAGSTLKFVCRGGETSMRSHRLPIVLTAINPCCCCFCCRRPVCTSARAASGFGPTCKDRSFAAARSRSSTTREGCAQASSCIRGIQRAIRRHRNPAAGRRERAARGEACHHRTRRRARSREQIRRQLCATVWARTRRDEGRATAAEFRSTHSAGDIDSGSKITASSWSEPT